MTVRDLAWAQDVVDARVRVPRFVRRSLVAIAEIAAAANEIGARLESIVAARMIPAIVPAVELAPGEWEQLRVGRRCFGIRGETRDAVLLLDEATVRRIVAAAFGETAMDRALSRFEERVLDRCIAQLGDGLRSLCGKTVASPEISNEQPRTYFELRFGPSPGATVGVALGASPEPANRSFVHANLLEACPIECRVRLGNGNVDIFTLAGLRIGDIVPLEAKVGAFATLNVGAETIAAGEGGIFGDRTAFKVHELI
jgi:flagellar motor switch/type III secretory pathway protein FliN